MRSYTFLHIAFVFTLCMFIGGSVDKVDADSNQMSFLDNGVVKIGIDLDLGGTITYFADLKSGENVINSHDKGRVIQQSYYSGPRPFGTPNPGYRNWPWNPVGCGDTYGNRATVLEYRNDGKVLYVKERPLQWALNNVPCECTFETWIELQNYTARIRNRLTNHRSDKKQYPAFNQELPAVYTIGKLYRLFTYTGPAPFTNAPSIQIIDSKPPAWKTWFASENWAALVNDKGWGLGVYNQGVYYFAGGFHGKPNVGGPLDDSTGYIGPLYREIIDNNIVYEYQYQLILGSLEQIRQAAYASQIDSKPNYLFGPDRQHWFYNNCRDNGVPTKGPITIILDKNDPQLIGPPSLWQATDIPTLYIRAAIRSKMNQAAIYFTNYGDPIFKFSESKKINFNIVPDGQTRIYKINMTSSPNYKGLITGIRFDPVPSSMPGEYIILDSITWDSDFVSQ